MLDLQDKSKEEFLIDIQDKKLFLFGAGRIIQYTVEMYSQDKKIEAIIDNNKKLWNTNITVNNQLVKIINIELFINETKKIGKDNIILWITSDFYGIEILEQLDKISELDGMRCYLTHLLRYHPIKKEKVNFSTEKMKIPKIIHYCWFGGNAIPNKLQKYIDGWEKKCPDYSIKCWNENNYDVSQNQYMLQAYKEKKWGFVTDCARLDIIYNEGGIYFDTDVELLRKPDCLLNDEAFFGYSFTGINLGPGFGAKKNNGFIKKLRDYYSDKLFINPNGEINDIPCNAFQHPVFKEFGFKIADKYQKINNIVLYPSGILADEGFEVVSGLITENTVTLHHPQLSWAKQKERNNINLIINKLKKRMKSNTKDNR